MTHACAGYWCLARSPPGANTNTASHTPKGRGKSRSGNGLETSPLQSPVATGPLRSPAARMRKQGSHRELTRSPVHMPLPPQQPSDGRRAPRRSVERAAANAGKGGAATSKLDRLLQAPPSAVQDIKRRKGGAAPDKQAAAPKVVGGDVGRVSPVKLTKSRCVPLGGCRAALGACTLTDAHATRSPPRRRLDASSSDSSIDQDNPATNTQPSKTRRREQRTVKPALERKGSKRNNATTNGEPRASAQPSVETVSPQQPTQPRPTGQRYTGRGGRSIMKRASQEAAERRGSSHKPSNGAAPATVAGATEGQQQRARLVAHKSSASSALLPVGGPTLTQPQQPVATGAPHLAALERYRAAKAALANGPTAGGGVYGDASAAAAHVMGSNNSGNFQQFGSQQSLKSYHSFKSGGSG